MELELRFFATFREAAGDKTVTAEFADGSTVGAVLRELESTYDEMRGRLIVDGDLAPQINVLKNGREVLHLDGLDTPLENGDRVSVFPPVAGGTAAADGSDPDDRPQTEAGWERETVAYRGNIAAARGPLPSEPRRGAHRHRRPRGGDSDRGRRLARNP